MHGRIVRYFSSNGKGVVINASKMLFEFTKEAWHDKKVIPMEGMFVEFRCDESNQIADCKASKFQEFGGSTFISESDFWRNQTDEQLEAIQSNKRDLAIAEIYKTTNYDAIKNIPLTLSIDSVIKRYFQQHFLAVSFLNDLYIVEQKVLLEFIYTKRFVFKALDNLLFNDKTLKKDDFIEELSVVVRLENFLSDFDHKVNVENLFLEYFIKYQLHYQALNAALENAKDTLKIIQRRIQACNTELATIVRKLESLAKKPQEILQKQEKLEGELQRLAEENKIISQRISNLSVIKAAFYKGYHQGFQKSFQKVHKMLYKKIKNGLDICITILDNKIYQKSLQSKAMKNCYFKYPENQLAPVSISFMEQYLDRLNKERLSEGDKNIYLYYQKLKESAKKFFLILSTNEKDTIDMKMKILGEGKFHCVKIAYKQIMFSSMMRDFVFDTIYIDKKSLWTNLQELIAEIKSFKSINNTKIVVF